MAVLLTNTCWIIWCTHLTLLVDNCLRLKLTPSIFNQLVIACRQEKKKEETEKEFFKKVAHTKIKIKENYSLRKLRWNSFFQMILGIKNEVMKMLNSTWIIYHQLSLLNGYRLPSKFSCRTILQALSFISISFQVFKFADQSSLYFHCQIRLSLRRGSCKVYSMIILHEKFNILRNENLWNNALLFLFIFCHCAMRKEWNVWYIFQRSSDNCSVEQGRIKREPLISSRNSETDAPVVDVFSQFMTVFDIDDAISTFHCSSLH